MRRIFKNEEPGAFVEWKRRNIGADWDTFSGDEPTQEYHELRQALLIEQDEMCCYCELALQEEKGAHIEHFKDRARHRNQIFVFQNLLASCKEKESCGQIKGKGYFSGMLCPLDDNTRARITYTPNGKMIPYDENDKDAEDTIKLLGLNCNRLKRRRESIIKRLNNVTDISYIEDCLVNCIEWHGGFYSAIEYVLIKKQA